MRLKQAIKKALYGFKATFVKVTVAQIQSGVSHKGKKIVITGGSRGLGRAMAEKFIAEGATVLITGKKPENLEKAKVEINSPLLYIKAFDAENIVDIPVFFEYFSGLSLFWFHMQDFLCTKVVYCMCPPMVLIRQ